jgi:uncharacterized protein YjdB
MRYESSSRSRRAALRMFAMVAGSPSSARGGLMKKLPGLSLVVFILFATGLQAQSNLTPLICYKAHVQDIGWQAVVCDGETAGTTGLALRMEAIAIKAPGRSICYQAHVEGIGWQEPVCDGAEAGTVGQALRIEALKVWIQSGSGHVEYFGHVQDIGWTGPAWDGAVIGTTGQGLRLEAVIIRIVP